MIQIELILRENPRNPLGAEVVRAASEQSINIRFHPNAIRNVTANLVCPDHPDEDSIITLDDTTNILTIDACCPQFRNTIENTLRDNQLRTQ